MELNIHLLGTGDRIRRIRKDRHMNQVVFYKALFPDHDLTDENIKKKMNSIENGKMKRMNFEFIFRLCEVFDISLDYLFGFETEYPNYENKAASQYTGLSAGAVEQLHFWKRYTDITLPDISSEMSDAELDKLVRDKTRKNESRWILDIASKLFEQKSDADKKSGITDLSVLYDIYMMSLDAPKTISGIPEESINSSMPPFEKFDHRVKIASDTISFTDQMKEFHTIDIGKVNEQIWKERLSYDLNTFIDNVKKNRD